VTGGKGVTYQGQAQSQENFCLVEGNASCIEKKAKKREKRIKSSPQKGEKRGKWGATKKHVVSETFTRDQYGGEKGGKWELRRFRPLKKEKKKWGWDFPCL